jgi:hypothetical protein
LGSCLFKGNKMANENDKPLRAQRWALWIAVGVYLAFLLVYLFIADVPFIHIRAQADKWGQFGDYVGGVINPVVGLITIWLLAASLKQSQQEMALTRKALEDAERSQRATEATLREQIKVSEHARDMANAVELHRYFKSRITEFEAKIKEEHYHHDWWDENMPPAVQDLFTGRHLAQLAREDLGNVLQEEAGRLVRLHNPTSPTSGIS